MPVEVLLFTLIFISTCVFHLLPGVVLLRRRDWSWAVVCLALGAAGILLFIPWVAAVILAARRTRFTPLRHGSPVPTLCRILGVVLVILAGVFICWGLRDYWQATDLSMKEFYADVIINSLVGCVGLLVVGIFLLVVPSLRGKGMWGGLIAVPALLMRSAAVNIAPSILIILILVLLAASLGTSAVVLRHTASPEPDSTSVPTTSPSISRSGTVSAAPTDTCYSVSQPKAAPAAAHLCCISGQYAGADFPLADGEPLCLGSSPELAHLVFSQREIAPLHAEITYQQKSGTCLLAHLGPVFLNGRALPQMCELHNGDTISFGSPRQGFQIQI